MLAQEGGVVEDEQQQPNGGPAERSPRAETTAPASVAEPTADAGEAGESAAPGAPGAVALGPDGLPRPKRRRRGKRGGKRHRKKPASEANGTGAADDGDDTDDGDDADEPRETPASDADAASRAADDGAPAQPRPQRQRQPQKPRTQQPRAQQPRKPAAPPAGPVANELSQAVAEEAGDAVGDDEAGEANGEANGEATTTGTGAPRKRRRRRRGGAKRKPAGQNGGAATDDAEDASEAAEKPAAEKTAAPKPTGGGSTRLAARALRKEKQRQTRRPRRKLTEEDVKRLRGGDKTMLIHEHDDRTQIAVLEEGVLIEHYVNRRGQRSTMAGNIYLGKVQNVLPGMEAAFVDFGRGRNGVLYAGEVNYSAEDLEGGELPRIEKVLRSGQSIMVQVTKDPIGAKGARLTSQVSLAGRYLVLAPEQQVSGISRRLSENERSRLRQILRDISPKEHGIIVRTAAEGVPRDAIERDLNSLLKIWDEVQKTAKRAKAPHLLYAEPELITRVVRDIFSEDFVKVVVDSRGVYDEIRSYLEDTAPDLLPKLVMHEAPLRLFDQYRVSEQLHKALERKVWLPSGGSIVIDRTEAMTVIDVNTGKFTGKGGNLEETVFKNNLEAAEEVARQLRLRDIGGIIVVDFIDMIDPKNQQEMLRTMKRALAKDKTRSQVFDVSNLGLVEMTRKKVSEGLLEAFSEPCPNCDGRGIVITHEID